MKVQHPQIIVHIGPNFDQETCNTITTSLQKTSLEHAVHDRRETGVPLRKSLRRLPYHTQRHYLIHGTGSNGTHYFGAEKNKTALTLDLMKHHKHNRGALHVWSCHAGAIKSATYVMDDGVPVILHSGNKYTTLTAMNAEGIGLLAGFYQDVLRQHGRASTGAEDFEFTMLVSPETGVYCEKINGEVKTFKARAPRQPIRSKEELERYRKDQLQRFREFRVKELGYTPEDFINMDAYLTPQSFRYYMEHALIMESGRSNSEHAEKYVAAYLGAGANPNASLTNNSTALKIACSQNIHIKVLEHLLNDERIDVNIKDSDLRSPLHFACQEKRADAVKLLLTHKGIDINQTDAKKRTVLAYACVEGNTEIVKILLEQEKTAVNQPDDEGYSPLALASDFGFLDIVKLLINDERTDVNQSLPNGSTPLSIAIETGNVALVRCLLRHGKIDVNKADNEGCTPLFIACQEGYTDIVELLLNQGADINKSIYGTITPLMIASLFGHEEVVELLLEHTRSAEYLKKKANAADMDTFCQKHGVTCDNSVRQVLGKSALEIAREYNHTDCAAQIEEKMEALDKQRKQQELADREALMGKYCGTKYKSRQHQGNASLTCPT